MRLSVQNQLADLPQTPYSFTSTDGTAGGTVINVKNINQFLNQYAVQIGKTGEEQAEILNISGVPSGSSFNTSGTIRFSHPTDTPVYQVHYDKVIFKRSTSGTAGTATALSSGTVAITPDSYYTEFEDTSGAVTYAYKTQFYNSVSGDVSAESDWFVPGGPAWYSLQKLRDRVKNKLISSSYIKEDAVIDDWINEYMEELNTAAIKVNQGYLLGTTSVTFGTAGLGTITATDFMYAQKVEINFSGTAFIPSTYLPIQQVSDLDNSVIGNPIHTYISDTVIKVLPAGSGGTINLTYAKGEPVLDSDIDELPHPMRHYTRGFTYYALACAQELDGKDAQSDKNYSKAQKVKADFLSEIVPKDNTGPKYIDLTEELSGMQEDDPDFLW